MKPLRFLHPIERYLNNRPKWAACLVFGALPFLLLIGFEVIHRQGAGDVLAWLVTEPFEALLSYLLVFLLGAFVYALIGRTYAAFVVTGLILYSLTFISSLKSAYLQEPLMPWDLLLSQQATDLMPYLNTSVGGVTLVVVILTAVALLVIRQVVRKPRVRWPVRVALAAGAVTVFGTAALNPQFTILTMERVGVYNLAFDQAQNYRQNGFALGFTMNLGNAVVVEPESYSRESIQQTLDNAGIDSSGKTGEPVLDTGSPTKDQPNVIIVMSEAFWDPTVLPNVTFSRDPMPNLRALMEAHSSGWLYSPQFGGGTANVEFEVLTGNSMKHLPFGSVAYQQFVKKPLPSLASILAHEGYKSVAVHSYVRWFWKREQVYPLLGFERFISAEDMMNPVYRGPFIADTEINRQIIRQTENVDRPVFVYAVTMQNHGPYDVNRYENTIQVDGRLSTESKQNLETYVQGISDSDQALQELIEHYQHSDEPTVVVFFGDHLPLLGDVYQESGFIDGSLHWDSQEKMRMHRVPLLIWNNYGQEKQDLPGISAMYLGAHLLDRMGERYEEPYFQYVNQMREKIPVLRNGIVIDKQGNRYGQVPPDLQAFEQEYQRMQYDTLFGSEYMYGN